MTWKTHMLGGIQTGLILAAASGAEPKMAAVEVGASALGSILPDIDHPNSKISNSDVLFMITSQSLSKITRHRREVHTVWASFLFGIIAFIFLSISSLASTTGASFMAGLVCAIVIDMLGGKIGSFLGLSVFLLMPQFLEVDWEPIGNKMVLVIAFSIFLGCISHLIYDSANKQGIMWLHPFKKKRFHFMNIQTESKGEDYFFFVMLLVTFIMFVALNPFGSPSFIFSKLTF